MTTDRTGRADQQEIVGGNWMEQTIAEHVRRAEHYIVEEQAKIAPDNALIALLCDSVRMSREYLSNASLPDSLAVAQALEQAAALIERHGKDYVDKWGEDEGNGLDRNAKSYAWDCLQHALAIRALIPADLAAEAHRDKEDAERYRWLRAKESPTAEVIQRRIDEYGLEILCEEALDVAIDTARRST